MLDSVAPTLDEEQEASVSKHTSPIDIEAALWLWAASLAAAGADTSNG